MTLRSRLNRLERLKADEDVPEAYGVIHLHMNGGARFNDQEYPDLGAARAAAARPCVVIECCDMSRPRPGEVTA